MSAIRPVVLSGGSGTRLWPLSTPDRPKQFADLTVGAPTLFDATLDRLRGIDGIGAPIVVTGARQLGLVEEALARAGVADAVVIVEPRGRNTAPAVAAAALVVSPEDVLVILPSDHLIADGDGFRAAVRAAVGHARQGRIVTFGVVPDRPDTGYGYIEIGDEVDGARRVARFKEKPSSDEAARFVAGGLHLWNSGMFVTAAGTTVEELERTKPDILATVRRSLPDQADDVLRLGDSFGQVEEISFDHAVMEHTDRALVIPVDVGWDDVGSFLALHAHSGHDASGNAVAGKVILDGVTDSLVVAGSRVVAVAGMSGIAVIETPDAVVVVPLDQAQRVRGLAERAEDM